ncbi:hypothetical protein Taro_000110, partial [Colocasia esculenta]|nr:hypothetical protein [Colocasia esculenta]
FPSVLKEDLVGYPGWCNSLRVKEDQLSWFPSVLKEDLVEYPGWCNSLRVKEDQLSWVLIT